MRPHHFKTWWIAALLMLALAILQLFVVIRKDASAGSWFLYGRDTVFHDAVVHIWIQQWTDDAPATIPLWADGIQGGLPTLGSFLWTPFSPLAWPFLVLNYPAAQKLAWLLCLWVAGMGAFALGRALRLRFEAALFCGAAWMLSGHLVTLIHAGHFQKVVALSWVGWAMAGTAMATDPHSLGRRARGIGVGALGLGMMLLGGHPQIAYISLVMMTLYAIWSFGSRPLIMRRWFTLGIGVAVMLGMGLALGGAQLLPGMEMAAVSNRGAGVEFEEAVETSYPPGELAEIWSPRVKGSSVRGDIYEGDWGERIVSDFAGRAVLIFAIIGLLGSWQRWRFVMFWAIVVLYSLIIGLGKYTPLYWVFYEIIPGFKSFRSPGTFMAAAMFAIPVLSGYGVHSFSRWWTHFVRGKRWGYWIVYTVMFLVAIADLGWANRFFLIAEPWQRYGVYYLGANELDLWLLDNDIMRESHALDPMPPGSLEPSGREQSLRPILYGGRALNGYHPVYYGIKKEQDQIIGINTEAWYKSWGVTRLLYPVDTKKSSISPPVEVEQVIPSSGRMVFRILDAKPFAEAPEGGSATFVRTTPNSAKLEVNSPPGLIYISEISPTDLEIYSGDQLISRSERNSLGIDIDHGGGSAVYDLVYRPRSYRHGLFATAIALVFILGLIVFGWRCRPPGYMQLFEESAPDPNYGRPLSYRDYEVIRHSHGEVGESDS